MSFLFIILLQLMVSFSDSSFTCDPETDCKITGELVPDSENCFNYYYCLSAEMPSAGPFTCPDGKYYDTTVGRCEYGTAVNECYNNFCVSSEPHGCVYTCLGNTYDYIADLHDCSKYHECAAPNPDSDEQHCDSPNEYFNGDDCVDDASKCCNYCKAYCHLFTQIANPCDCNTFFVCTHIGPVDYTMKGTCAEGRYFDEQLQDCVLGANCNSTCTPEECDF